jgi:predicted nucleic-acid-binding protein
MTSLDTNVIVHYIMQDDPQQSAQATVLIEKLTEASPGFVSVESIIKLVWVLESAFSLARTQVVEALVNLMSIDVFKIERVGIVVAALRTFRKGNADFADCLIERSSAGAGCEKTVTFDRAAAKTAGMVLIK